MYTYISKTEFMDTMRARRPDNFTYEGLSTLFDALEEIEEATGEELQFDPVGICCRYSEYASAIDALRDLGGDLADAARMLLESEDEETAEDSARNLLRDHTMVWECHGGAVVIDSEF